MKKIILILAAALLLPAAVDAGEIARGSVPGTLNYQGRLERDNAPITGTIHLYFRVFNSASANNTGGAACGAVSQPCLWESPELTVQATQGIFSANITPPFTVLAGGQSLYLEVQVESDTLSPREPLNSVAYAVVAKKLEDGADVLVSTLAATYNVSLATAAGAVMTVGTDAPANGARLTLDGWLKINTGGIIFPDNSSMNVASVASAGNIANDFDADILGDRDGNATGGVVMRKPTLQYLRITNSGLVGIGPNFTDSGLLAPKGALDVDGTLYVGNEGIYDRDDTTVNIMANLSVRDGRVTGDNGEYIALGEANNVIVFGAGGEQMRVHSNGFLGVGTNSPAMRIHSVDNIAADAGVRGGRVSIGDYSTWTNLLNEVRAEDTYNLLLQQTNPYNVGIGTDTPREKLHVRGSVRSDYGIIAATAAFSGNVRVNGTFSADSKQGNTVELSSTTINGWLVVSGGIGSAAGLPAYIASTQTFTGLNTFQNQVVVSSDIFTLNRVGAGVVDFDFPGTKYLQVGDNQGGVYANDNGLIYLVGGSNANAKLNFYRGTTLGATLETQGASNLALVVGGQTKTLTDSVYHRIQNSAVWISTGYNTTPAIFVSSYMGNVGMGTAVMDPNWKLTVAGNIRLSGSGSAIIFADGTSMTTSSATSANNLSANGDAIVQSNADLSGGGDVILRAGSLDGLVLNTGGYVGIGTLNPVSKLNLRGGDLVLGSPNNPYSSDSMEDLVVAGNIAFDGELVQRSGLPVKFSELIVAEDVFLSTSGTGLTGINTLFPVTKLDVNGNAQFGSGVTKSTFTATGALQLASPLGVAYGGAGASLSAVATGGILYKSGVATVGGTGALTGMLKGNTAGAPSAVNGTANYITYWSDANTIAAEQYAALTRGGSNADLSGVATGGIVYKAAAALAGTGALTGMLKGNTAGAPSAVNGTANYNTYWSDANTIAAEQYTALTRGGSNADLSGAAQGGLIYKGAAALAATGALTGVLKGNDTGAPSAMTGTASTLARWTDANTIGTSIVTDNGTNAGVGVAPTAGIKLDVNGKLRTTTFQMTSGSNNNYVLASDGSGNASWVDPAGGSLGDGVVGNEIRNVSGTTLVRDGTGITVDPYTVRLNLANPNTWTALQIFTSTISAVLSGTIGNNDYYRIMGAGPADNAGYLEIATADDGSEPIYVRQYTGTFTALARTATLLNATGDTSFPGTVSAAAFSGNISGNATTATALAANGGNCTLPNVAMGVSASGVAECSQPSSVTGNAATATALAANGSNCALPNVALGVDASGDAECGQPSNVTGTAANVTGTVAVANGGTGRATLTAGRVLVGDGTNPVALVNGVTANYTVVVDTFPYTCSEFQFTNGILIAVVGGTCP